VKNFAVNNNQLSYWS